VSDVSAELVSQARTLANELRPEDQMSFAQAAAEDLSPIPDATVDVVTTRSVLIDVDDKARLSRSFIECFAPVGESRSSNRSIPTSLIPEALQEQGRSRPDPHPWSSERRSASRSSRVHEGTEALRLLRGGQLLVAFNAREPGSGELSCDASLDRATFRDDVS
jgi:Methyltransferase domain